MGLHLGRSGRNNASCETCSCVSCHCKLLSPGGWRRAFFRLDGIESESWGSAESGMARKNPERVLAKLTNSWLCSAARRARRSRHRGHGFKIEFGFRDALLNRPLEPLAPFHQINITCQTTREIAAEHHHLSLTMSGFGSGAEPALGGAASGSTECAAATLVRRTPD